MGFHLSLDGRLFITDTLIKRVHVFSTDGALLDRVCAPGMAAGEFTEPTNVCAISPTKILVLDRQHDRVSGFSPK